MSNKDIWTIKLDWLNILRILGLDSINQISEVKMERAIKKLSKTYGTQKLMELEPDELDHLLASELKDLMKRELALNAKKKEKMEKEVRSKVIPFKHGGIIRLDPRDFKDLDPNSDPEEIFNYFYKKLVGDDDEDDDDDDKYNDKTGFYI